MTTDNPGQSPDGWLTLTEAAGRTGHTRDAIRQRVRRGSLRASKGNDGVLRVDPRDLADLPPPDVTTDDQGTGVDQTTDAALDVLIATVADLRTDLERSRTALDKALADHLDSHGRAAKAEAQAIAEAARAAVAEARLATAEAALAEARTPWTIRLIRAWRRQP